MATLVIPNTYQVAIEMSCSGQPVWNVLHFNYGGGFVTPSDELTRIKNAWEVANGPLKLRPAGVTMVGYHFTNLASPTGAVAFLGSSTAGAGVSGISTMASSALLKLGTGTRSRSQQGRMYHGPLLESQINTDGRTVDPTFLTAINLAYNTFKSSVNVGGVSWAVASRKLLSSTPIGTVSTAGVIATQRRRLR